MMKSHATDTILAKSTAAAAFLLVATLGMGCVLDDEGLSEEELGQLDEGIVVSTGSSGYVRQTSNGLLPSSLQSGVSALSLPSSSLDSLRYSYQSQLNSSATRDFLRYTVACALHSSQSVKFQRRYYSKYYRRYVYVTDTYYGSLGYAPEWKSGSCGTECQQLVTGCVLARTNYEGANVTVKLATYGTVHDLDFPWIKEGGFYGNFFYGHNEMYFCSGSSSLRYSKSVFADGPVHWAGHCHPEDWASQGGDTQACILRDSYGEYQYCATGDYQTYNPAPVSSSFYKWVISPYFSL